MAALCCALPSMGASARRVPRALHSLVWVAMLQIGGFPKPGPGAGSIPLCPGLTVVTAISQPEGDYESIKTVESMDANTVRLKYSTEQPPERLAGGGSRIRKLTLSRVVRISDLANGKLYEQIFGTNIPAEMPGTTAIGTSRAVLT